MGPLFSQKDSIIDVSLYRSLILTEYGCSQHLGQVTVKKSQHKKWSFLLTISSVNETKSAENCGFGHIY